MSAFDYSELIRHVGHNIVCVQYGNGANVSVECEDCNEILLDYDEPQETSSYIVHATLPLVFRVDAEDEIHAEDQVYELISKGLTPAELNNYIDGDIEINDVEEDKQ